jgi:hypothetical protein
LLDPCQGRLSQVHNRFLKSIAAFSRQYAYSARRCRSRPVDILARQKVAIIERPRIAEIAWRTNFGIQFDDLPVAERRQRFARFGIQRDLRTRVPIQFQKEPLAFARHRRRFHHTPVKNHHFASGGVDLGRRTRSVYERVKCAGEKQP